MNNLLHLLMLATLSDDASGAPPATLSDPTQMSARRLNSAGSSINSDTVNPGSGALVLVIVRHRNATTTDVAHNVPTTDLANMHDFGAGARFELIGTDIRAPFASVRVSVWWGYSTGATGDGVVTANYGASADNRMIEVLRFQAGWNAAPIGQIKTGNNASGTSLSLTFDGAPAAASAAIFAFVENQNGSVGDHPSGWTLLGQSTLGSLHAITAYKRGSVGTGPQTITNLPTTLGRAGVINEVKQI